MRPPPSPQPRLPPPSLSLLLSAPPHRQRLYCSDNNCTCIECVVIAAAAGGSDALPWDRPRREAPTRLQLAEAPSLKMWRLSHQQEVCSTTGPSLEGAMHHGRSGTDSQKTITPRLETVGTKWIAGVRTESDQLFAGNHPDDSRGSETSPKEMFLGDVCTVSTSTILTAAICTNWLTTLCMSTVHVSDLGSQITIQLSNCSWTRSGSACFAFWLAGSGDHARDHH